MFTDDGTLTGVVAWTHPPKFPDLVQIPVLAVAIGHQRRGYGRALKTAVMDRARSEGSVGVISTVHEDNDAMNRLNNTLGGIAERDSTDHSYLVWIIDL